MSFNYDFIETKDIRSFSEFVCENYNEIIKVLDYPSSCMDFKETHDYNICLDISLRIESLFKGVNVSVLHSMSRKEERMTTACIGDNCHMIYFFHKSKENLYPTIIDRLDDITKVRVVDNTYGEFSRSCIKKRIHGGLSVRYWA